MDCEVVVGVSEVELSADTDEVKEKAGELVVCEVVPGASEIGVSVEEKSEIEDKKEEEEEDAVEVSEGDVRLDDAAAKESVLEAEADNVGELGERDVDIVVSRVLKDEDEVAARVPEAMVVDLTIGGGRTNGEQGSVDIKSLAT
ncbi:MAG: hypothetical protein L6R40_005959 [Gallowayella cf. fulva]|nr:MAG: hypothetical protein L6R40_005959 [Xanthomendoza cf. fulva]